MVVLEDTNINISFVTDENYFKHMFIAIESIIKNTNKERKLIFFILNLGIEKESMERLIKKYKNQDYIKINFVNVDDNKVSLYKIKTHVSKAAYAKIYISDLIKEKKVIYLDCDLILNADIKLLWNEFEEQIILKAVWNPFYNYDNKFLGVENNVKTFNSGVMLLDLENMRNFNSSEKLEEFLVKFHDKTKLHDQAAFNAVYKDSWKELDYTWNYQVSMIQNSYKRLKIKKVIYSNLFKNPHIIHFTSNSKPWDFRNRHPYKHLYKEYHNYIYGEISYSDVTIKSLLQRLRERGKYLYYIIINTY